jgi:hypothetical protein
LGLKTFNKKNIFMNMEKHLLNEEIVRVLVNMNYNPAKTLNENIEDTIDEQRVGGQALRDINTAFKDLGNLRSLMKIGIEEGKLLKYLQMDMKSFEKEFAKAVREDLKAGVPAGTLGPKAKELSKIDFARRVSDETARKGRQLSKAEMDAIKNATKADNLGAAAKVKIKKPVIDDGGGTGGGTGGGKIPPPPVRKKWDTFKKWAKGAGLVALGAGVLYAIYKFYNGDESELEKIAKKCGYSSAQEYISAGYVCPKKGGTPVPPKPTNIKNCENKEFQTYGCKSSYVRRVQECIGGLIVDGVWGKNTNDALSKLGYASGFDKDDVETICSKALATKTPSPTPTPGTSDRGKEGPTPVDGNASSGQSNLASNSGKSAGFDPNAMD